MSKAWRESNRRLIQQATVAKEKRRREEEAEAKTGVRRKPMPSMGPADAEYARMAREPNPTPASWMSDPSQLPKRPPTKA